MSERAISPEQLKEHASQPVLLIDTRGSQCRWIEGPADAEALCCGALPMVEAGVPITEAECSISALVDGDLVLRTVIIGIGAAILVRASRPTCLRSAGPPT